MSQKYDITIKDIFSNMADDITAYFLGLTYTKTDELYMLFCL
ncbi:hypothetical protein [Thermoanaerobacter sp. RKWS2]